MPGTDEERRHQQRRLEDHHGVQERPREQCADHRVGESRGNRPAHEDARLIPAHEVQCAGEQAHNVEKLSGLVDQIRRAGRERLGGHPLRERVLDSHAAQRHHQCHPAKRPLPEVRLRTRMAAEQGREEAHQKHGAGELADEADDGDQSADLLGVHR